ncbi:penicillin-binding protein activator LpoB [Rhodopirellula halodulae]|uniref:penicillin-binding protein activator LpoB n=1 Tax=Rhodopirellula halodulae TaxID=2894198 RepID=UPI0027D271F6|nr:penicillin-binding protein activator LpoB [Rhodopirellula sp. JC740]
MDGNLQTKLSQLSASNSSPVSPDETQPSPAECSRREMLVRSLARFGVGVGLTAIGTSGCASHRYGHLLASDDKDMVGSHEAGAATWNPLVDEAVAKILSRCPPPNESVVFPDQFAAKSTPAQMASHSQASPETMVDPSTGEAIIGSQVTSGPLVQGPAKVCFIGIENKSAEELVDFKDQLYERIDSQINSGSSFRSISRRMVDAALIETRLRPDSLFLPQNRSAFAAALGRQGTPVDYLLYATITTGTTDRNKSTQRDYLLTLEMVNLQSGDYIKESSKIRKGYHNTRAGKWWNFGMFDQADG